MTYKKWCARCNRYHDSPPVDPESIKRDHAKELADEIDRQVLDQILRRALLKSSKLIHTGKMKK